MITKQGDTRINRLKPSTATATATATNSQNLVDLIETPAFASPSSSLPNFHKHPQTGRNRLHLVQQSQNLLYNL